MKPLPSRRPRLVCATASVLLSMFATAWAVPVKHSGGDAQKPQTAPVLSAAGATYVGSEQCKICHADQARMMQSTPHFRIFGADKQAGAEGCEICHGPGSAHIDGGGDRSKISRLGEVKSGEVLGICLNCHSEGANQMHFNRSQHASAAISCGDCHRVHTSKAQPLLAEKDPDLCFGCHKDKKSDFAKPFHHRVNEDLVQCDDCHNVHGTATVRQARSLPSGDAVCYKCHADKQGPWAYEHAPVRENCDICHNPHGAVANNLLKQQPTFLCLRCHPGHYSGNHHPNSKTNDWLGIDKQPGFNTPTATSLRRPLYTDCTLCHQQVHGTNQISEEGANGRFTR